MSAAPQRPGSESASLGRRSRGVASVLLLVLAALLIFGASATSWATRTIFDTDTFVSTSESTMRQPEVQDALSVRIADAIVTRGDLQARTANRLPEGLAPLAQPLTEAERTLIQRSALRLLQSPEFQQLVDQALRRAHARIVAILEDDKTVIQVQGTSIVLDLGQVVTRVQEDIGATERGGPLSGVSLPPDTGQIVLVDHAGGLRAASFLAQNRQTIVAVMIGAAVGAVALAIGVANDRRVAVRRAGVALAIAGGAAVIALAPARYAVESLAKNEDAARAAFNQFTEGLRWQSLGLIVAGLLVTGGAVLAGDSHAARAVRAARGRERDLDAPAELRAADRSLVVGAIVVAAIIVVAWPQPGARVYATAIALLVAFFALLALLSSDAGWARSSRARIRRAWSERPSPPAGAGPVRTWVTREVRDIQLIGVLLAVAALLFWPGLTAGSFVLIVLGAVLFVASVEWLSSAGARAGEN